LTRVVADIETLEDFYARVVTPPVVAALVTALACTILARSMSGWRSRCSSSSRA
jgi:ABC-type transport system involved in cytochrome bd biosynthesis fused ATPase/permease subunit